ncbi:aldehyde dehydrogenase family protein [Mycolicibacterium sp.]|uniref:aldehyde dehydrogenase family protein n=1 Tax=Mycolicibacterium sp. TaxID=2320850 RepID=UPI001A23FE45|nr:aldehyde dehydrogenase family protein [Mycolicibacterium sp.]MBJ7336103.1 aldehyde dehydrogenase family protein [Mycolicibacterium sp.]
MTTTVGTILELQRAAFVEDGIPDLTTRIDRVSRLQSMVLDHTEELVAALAEDFGTRAREVSVLADVVGCMGDLEYQKKHLRSWMRTRSRGGLLGRSGLRQQIRHDPLGVVGVMGPWNFPVQLTMLPAGTALAAGNRVMVRPSEITVITADLLATIAPQYFSIEELAVVTDDRADGPTFATLEFDHLFFTGSPSVGALVAQTAAKNLVPVTLELGGKNPVVVDRSADLRRAASRIASSRMVNGGQVCMCPDYVLVPEESMGAFVEGVLSQWRSAFPRIVANDDYTSVVTERHFDHVVGLIDDAVSLGAESIQHVPSGETLPDRGSRKIAPTILTGVPPEARVNREEIFGPVLVVHPYRELSEAIDYVNAGPHPLTIYWYGKDNDRYDRLQCGTRSGSVNANDFTLNFIGSELPFGGVGRSGTGAYRGRAGFDTFTHARGVAFSRWPVSLGRMMAPPFGRRDARLVNLQLSAFRRRNARKDMAR